MSAIETTQIVERKRQSFEEIRDLAIAKCDQCFLAEAATQLKLAIIAGKADDNVTSRALAGMTFLSAVVSEALRRSTHAARQLLSLEKLQGWGKEVDHLRSLAQDKLKGDPCHTFSHLLLGAIYRQKSRW